jgi:hypothetical protein
MLADAAMAARVLDRVRRLSAKYGTSVATHDVVGVVAGP